MKKIFTQLLSVIALFSTVNSYAQINRANTKKTVVYQSNFQRIASGIVSTHTLEIRNGELWGWGLNGNGQLGDGTTTDRTSPVRIGTDTKWAGIAEGAFHSIGLKSDGTIWTWGSNNAGVLGDGNINNVQTSPKQVGSDNKWISVAAGQFFSFGIKSDGTLWAWGSNSGLFGVNGGQLGDGTTINRRIPVKIGTDNKWVSISSGFYHTLGLKSDGTLWAWGNNSNGQLGDGTNTDKTSPVLMGTDNNWVSITAGGYHSLGLKSDGTLWAWGENSSGSLGDGTTINKNTPVQVGTDNKWVNITAGYTHSLGIKTDGSLWAWGENSSGSLGDGTAINRNTPVQIGTDNRWVSIVAGYYYNHGLKSDGTLWAWGYNGDGQLGDGTNTEQTMPVQTQASLDGWLSIAAGYNHNAGLKSNGTIYTWGNNAAGQLGDAANSNRTTPILVGTDDHWISIDGGDAHTVGIKSDGTLWAWGFNEYGQLGDGSINNKNEPVKIGNDNKWVSVSAGLRTTLGIKSDGTLWAWGSNENGQLINDGNNSDQIVPVQIGTDNKWVSVEAGNLFSFGIKSDGTLWAWGLGEYGQLGDGTETLRNSPVQIGTDNRWVSVTAGYHHALGLKSDGTIWAWGLNEKGQLGDGTILQRNSPVQVESDNKWIKISAGASHSIGIKSDGTLWAWGENITGQLGNGTNTNSASPVQIGADNKWVVIAAGAVHSIGLKSERNQYCATGTNGSGELGDNTTVNGNSFVCNTNINCIAPPAPLATNQTINICKLNTATLSATGFGTLSWYDAASGGNWLASGATFTTPVLSSNHVYYVQDSTCTAGSARTAVSVILNPNIFAQPSDTSVCAGSPVTLTGSGGALYSWHTNVVDGIPFVPVATDSYYVTGTDSNGCSANSDTITITVINFTVDSIVGPANACPYMASSGINASNNATYSIRANNASTFNWSLPAGATIVTGTSTSNTISAHFAGTFVSGTIAVTVAGSCGGTETRSVAISKSAPAVPGTITGPANACPYIGTSIPVTYSIAPVAGAITYRWTLPTTVTLLSASTDSTSITISYNAGFDAGANKSIRVRSISGCGNSIDKTLTISVTKPAVPIAITGPTNACIYIGTANEATYTTRLVSNATSYSWTVPAGASITSHPNGAGPADTVITVAFDNSFVSGSVISVQSVSGCGLSTARTLAVTRTLPATPGVISGPSDACPLMGTLNTATYTIRKVTNATSYNWAVPPGAAEIHPNGPGINDTIIVVTYSNAFLSGTITVNAANGCGSSLNRSLTITRNVPATPGVITGSTDPCPFIGVADVTYTVRKLVNTTSYSWSVPAGATITDHPGGTGINDTIITVAFTNAVTTGNISVIANNNCASSAARNLAIVRKLPATPGVITGATNPCPFIGTSDVTYTIRKVANATFYTWAVPTGAAISAHPGGAGINDTIITVTFTNAVTTGNISVIANNSCASSTARNLAIVRVLPATPGVISGPTDPCPFIGVPAVTYSILKVANANSYTWSVPAGASISSHPGGSGINDTIITVTFTNAITTGNISVTANNNCASSLPRNLAIVRKLPAVPGAITTTVLSASCPNRQYFYSIAALPLNATSVAWIVPAGGTIISQGTLNVVIQYGPAAVMDTLRVVGVNNCTSSGERKLAVSLPACALPKGAAFTAPAAINNTDTKLIQVKILPNPTSSHFNLELISTSKGAAMMRVMDVSGRQLSNKVIVPYQVTRFGNELKTGVYFVEVLQGTNRKTVKLIKQ
jgi:alpha-tubulin suppressor-like RCC1 family protein